MATSGDTLVLHLQGLRPAEAARRVREAFDGGRDVALIHNRDTVIKRVFALLAGLRVPHGGMWRLGEGQTVTLLAHSETGPAYAYWPRATGDEWVWACRACGAVDERWAWQEVDESTPMRREVFITSSREFVEVPWACPVSGCRGAPIWRRARPARSR